jgi:hypothetical protein
LSTSKSCRDPFEAVVVAVAIRVFGRLHGESEIADPRKFKDSSRTLAGPGTHPGNRLG